MNCTNHTDKGATGACVYCGKLFCEECLVDVNGKNYCRDCVGKAFDENKGASNATPNINITNTANAVANATNNNVDCMVSTKSKTTALILCILFGYIGAHRFYVGKAGSGIAYLFTGGMCGIGWIIDIISILSGSFRDNYGRILK